jgi:hypothetical protein
MAMEVKVTAEDATLEKWWDDADEDDASSL